jgi:metal-dependent hydrolase (beta-lactamase superfamily II)
MQEAGNNGVKCQYETNPKTYRNMRKGTYHSKRKKSLFIAAKTRPATAITTKTESILKGKKRLVVITGCGHSGIINILKYAKELTGSDRIYAVMGGMHLTGGTFEPIIPRTIDKLEESQA